MSTKPGAGHSKAFEAAESQARSYSLVGTRLRELVLTNTVKAVQEIRFSYNSSARLLPKDKADAADFLALELEKTSTLLLTELPKSAAISKMISRKMREGIAEFESGLTFNSLQIEVFEKTIEELQVEFLRTYNSEIGTLTILEFRRFKEQFDKEIPFYLQPIFVIAISVLLLVGSTIAIFRLRQKSDLTAEQIGREAVRSAD